MKTKDYGYYEKFFYKLVPDHNYRRLGKAFKTREKYYFYDTGTGKVFECEQEVYEILRKLEETNSFAVVLQIKLCSILQIIRSRFLLCYVNGNRLFGVDSALCFI